ncbi:MAG: TlpA family protein disulfide reductase [Clostridia bacterium]|nr:TlpA family protein disulfide reductase [Clostridia bacterium]
MKRILAILLVCMLALSGCAEEPAPQAPKEDAHENSERAEASPLIPKLSTTDVDGNTVDNSLFKEHKLTLFNIWATYCGPCLGEMPDLGALNREYADQGVQVVGLILDYTSEQDLPTIRTLIDETEADYIHLLPNETMIELMQNTYSVPTTYFLDENGAPIGEEYIGSRSKDAWASIIDSLLEEME